LLNINASTRKATAAGVTLYQTNRAQAIFTLKKTATLKKSFSSHGKRTSSTAV